MKGEDDDMEKKAVYLGGALEWWENGLGVRKHVRCRSISTPQCHSGEGDRSERPEVSAEFATKHRAGVARVVCLAKDRLNLGVAAVELAKTMAVPREGDDERLKRFARYLHGHPDPPDYIQWYPVQEEILNSCFDPRMPIGLRAENRVDRIQEELCRLEDHLIAAWSRVQPRIR